MEIEFERAAMNGEMMPDELPAEDQLLFLSLRNLYQAYRTGLVSREAATVEKKRLLYEVDKRKKLASSASKRNLHTVAMWKDTERYISEYRNNRTLETADRLADAMEGKVHGWNEIEEG